LNDKKGFNMAQRQGLWLPLYLFTVAVLVFSMRTSVVRPGASPLMLVAPMLSATGVVLGPIRSLWRAFVSREHYSRLNREMPFILSLALITSSSGLTIDHIFIGSLMHSETRAFAAESRKYLYLRLMGEAWDSCLEKLESGAPSSVYKAFIRGLRNVASTSLRLPEYVSSFFETYFAQLEALWRDYWSRASGLLESILLLVLSFITIYVSSLLLEGLLTEPLLLMFNFIVLFAGLLGALLLRSLRPTDILLLRNGRRDIPIIAAPWLLSLIVVPLDTNIVSKTLAIGAVLTVWGLAAELWRKRALLMEEELLHRLQRVEELVKSGYSVHFALRESGLTAIRQDNSLFLVTFAERLVRFISSNTERYGAVREDFASKMYTYLRRLLDVNNTGRGSVHAFMAIGLALPTLLAALSMKFTGSLIATGHVPWDLGYLFLSTAISVGILLSEAIDGFFALSLKPGIACLLLSLAFLFV